MDFQHITLEGLAQSINYDGSGRGNFKKFERSCEQRRSHGKTLKAHVEVVFEPPQREDYISVDEPGIYIEIDSVQGYPLSIESLDNSHWRLCSVIENDDGSQRAVVFVFDSKRSLLLRKLSKYEEQGDGLTYDKLFDNISSIRLASLQDFWTSTASLYPDTNDVIWWEVWLSRRSLERREVDEFIEYCNRAGISVAPGRLEFELYTVMCVQASERDLVDSTALISSLSEVRKVVDTPAFFLSQQPYEQADWVQHLQDRTTYSATSDVSVLVIDDGVNFNQPLIAKASSPEECFAWDDGWPKYCSKYAHATRQAGLILYGDLMNAVISDDPIRIGYRLESSRILPPTGCNDKELYGSLTYFSVHEAEKISGIKNRVISMAVTSDHDGITGQPTSWSSEVDQLSFAGESTRLFTLSGGNIRGDDISLDYRVSTQSFGIEDPGQAWNAITVGAYTEKEEIGEHYYKDWSTLAPSGDISPTSRTSNHWGWRSEAPIKPDVVEEGGNLLLSPCGTTVTNADCVSLITTADHASGVLFTDHRETSAATGLVSRVCAKVWETYPEYLAETIRGLVVHSSEWTPTMLEYRENAIKGGVAPKDAKEHLLRTFGHGVPSVEKAQASGETYLTLVVQDTIKPYCKAGSDLSFNEMHLIDLPWPQEELLALGNAEVSLRITLSYFIEPNPGRRTYSQRYRYQSFGLRFKLINKDEDADNFIGRSNVGARDKDIDYGAEDPSGWDLGSQLRTRGSLHQDTWRGSASDLALRNKIAIIPVAGWWKQNQKNLIYDRAEIEVPYSLIVSLDAADSDVDLYTPVAQQVGIDVPVEIELTF